MSRGSIVGGAIYLVSALGALLLGVAFDPTHAQTAGSATPTPLKFRQSFIPTESIHSGGGGDR